MSKNGKAVTKEPPRDKATKDSLYNRYRPRDLDEVVGQPQAVAAFEKFFAKGNFPHAVLLTGPSGCGKTTLAEIASRRLGCHPDIDFVQVDCAGENGPDIIRGIPQRMWISPVWDARLYLLDEFQSLSRAGFAQQATLRMLERPAPHCYFILTSMDTAKINRGVRTRCTAIPVKAVSVADLRKLVLSVAKEEREEISGDLAGRIAEFSNGSPREALVLLEKALTLDDEQERLDSVLSSEARREAIDVARKLLGGASFTEIAPILKELTEEAETLRRIVLAYMDAVLLGGGKMATRAVDIIQIFRDDMAAGGRAVFDACCWEVCRKK